MEIGRRIRQLRIKNDLTQEELASRCELTKGFLSQLENDLAAPSLQTLMDIVEALGTTMSQFFKEEDGEQIVFTRDDFFEDEKEDHHISWIVPNAQKNSMEPIILELKPMGRSAVMKPHEGEEFGLVLSGKVILVRGEEEFELKKGETFYINGDLTHYLKNDSGYKAQVLWISTPPLF